MELSRAFESPVDSYLRHDAVQSHGQMLGAVFVGNEGREPVEVALV